MEIWIATGDETGTWDIEGGNFYSGYFGVAWALAPAQTWERALQMPLGGKTALEVFSEPIAARLVATTRPAGSSKYHVMDVWKSFPYGKGQDVPLDVVQENPALELLRSDAQWLLQQSGLGILTVGGSKDDAKAAGLGISGDGMRERARAFAGLMTVALPFLPGDTSLNMLLEGRTESAMADVAWDNIFGSSQDGSRNLEPFRVFIGQLHEDLKKAASRCQSLVATGSIVDRFYGGGRERMSQFIANQLFETPFMKAHAAQVVQAMNGISDLAAALMPRPPGRGCRLLVPPGFSDNLWAGNFRELQYAIKN